MRKKKRLILCAVIAAVLLAALCAVSLLASRYGLSVSCYTVPSDKLTAPIRIVQLTDLHNAQFGEHNKRLVDRIAAQKPDLIVTTGDMMRQEEADVSAMLRLVEELARIAPVYCSMGNHELQYGENFPDTDLAAGLERSGARVVHFSWDEIEVNGQRIRIGGLYGYALPEKYNRHGEEQDFMNAFCGSDAYKILLCHIPEGMLVWGGLDSWDVDLTFCGHVHGGVVRLPLVGGLYSLEEKWFPTFTAGLKTGEQGSGILSRGLGTTGPVPRWNNIPEIVVADLVPE